MSNRVFDRMWIENGIVKAKETISEYEGHLSRTDISEQDRVWLKGQIEGRKKALITLKQQLGMTMI